MNKFARGDWFDLFAFWCARQEIACVRAAPIYYRDGYLY